MEQQIQKFTFEGQRDNEEVLKLYRQHPLVLFGAGLRVVALWLIVVGAIRLFGLSGITSYLFFAMLAATILYGGNSWILWRGHLAIVTNQRLVYQEMMNIANRRTSDVPYNFLWIVRYETGGLWGSLFDYGHVIIEGGATQVILKNLPRPAKAQEELTALVKKYGQGQKNLMNSSK